MQGERDDKKRTNQKRVKTDRQERRILQRGDDLFRAAGIKNIMFLQGDVGALPFETKDSLQRRLSGMYADVQVTSVEGIGCFKCRKEKDS